MAEPQQVTIRVPEEVSSNPRDRADLAAEIIAWIIDRTASGVGIRVRGRGFSDLDLSSRPYTEKYAKKKGVSIDAVDLVLNDEMLEAMQYFPSKSRRGEIVIGYKAGTKLNAKVEGNQIGSYGRSANPKKARPFLGITRRDLLDLI